MNQKSSEELYNKRRFKDTEAALHRQKDVNYEKKEWALKHKRLPMGKLLKIIFILALIGIGVYLFFNPDKIMDPVNNFMSQFGA